MDKLQNFIKNLLNRLKACGNCGKSHGKSASIALFLSGPSGVGKTTIENQLLTSHHGRWFKAKSTTTRPARGNHFEDQFYDFVSEGKFNRTLKHNGFFFNMTSNYAARVCYGFTNAEIDRAIQSGKVIVLNAHASSMEFIRDKLLKRKVRCVSVFLLPPSVKELKRRIESRGSESKAEIKRRLDNAESELNLAQYYDYKVVNDNPITTIKKVNDIICKAILDVEKRGVVDCKSKKNIIKNKSIKK